VKLAEHFSGEPVAKRIRRSDQESAPVRSELCRGDDIAICVDRDG